MSPPGSYPQSPQTQQSCFGGRVVVGSTISGGITGGGGGGVGRAGAGPGGTGRDVVVVEVIRATFGGVVNVIRSVVVLLVDVVVVFGFGSTAIPSSLFEPVRANWCTFNGDASCRVELSKLALLVSPKAFL